jgi:hypothetical protein
MVKKSDDKPSRATSLQVQEPGASLSNFRSTSLSNIRGGYSPKKTARQFQIFDDPAVILGYESVPLIEVDPLPRGGISLETKAVGRIQVCTIPVFSVGCHLLNLTWCFAFVN